MKNIGILGYGTVGRATAKHLAGSWERQLIAFDAREGYAKHVNAGNKIKLEDGARLDALIVCINLPQVGPHSTPTPQSFAAGDIRRAINDYVDVPLRETAPILVRSTVPPGTCELLQNLYPNNPVVYWPEFAKEASMRQGYEIKALYLGLSPKHFDEDKGTGRIVAGMLLNNTSLTVGGELPDCVYTHVQVEFMKLAWNVKRAADVAVFNELARQAVSLGIDPVMADHLAENAKPHPPQFSTLAFGGKCLEKDLWLWDLSFNSLFGNAINMLNSIGPKKAVKLVQRAFALLGIAEKRVTILGLQDGPSSGECSRSPAMKVLQAHKFTHAPALVDSVKSVREKFTFLLEKKHQYRQVVCEPHNDALVNTNAIIIAQSSHGSVIFNSLMKILQTSHEEIKIVVNACNMQFHDHQIATAQQWGAVFIDQVEIDRMRYELDIRNKADLVTAMIRP